MEEPGGNLFVTGRAGTGKSTLLRALRDAYADRMVVLAPTGLAAINSGGRTIHSFFGFPPRLIQPDDIKRSRNGRVMRKLDSSSSMKLRWCVRTSCGESTTHCASTGRPREPFGGARVLLFADLHQLPPVIQEREVFTHLVDTHGSPFFFLVPALQEGNGTSLLELDQSSVKPTTHSSRVLNAVRHG